MASEWGTYTFEELIENGSLQIGDGYRAKNEELGGDGHIFLRAGHVTDTHIDLTGAERFHEGLSDKVASKMAKARDVVITTKGNSTGRTTYITSDLPPLVYSPHLSFWRSTNYNIIFPEFLRYWAHGHQFQSQLEGLKVSTDMAPYLSLVDQKRLQITLPSPEDQRSIAEILSALDDKIELNRRMNATLEAMAQALFKSWFVDFDPVKAKAEGRAPEGMDAETAALFPNEFVESEMGPIPKGWKFSTIGENFALTMGQSPPGETYNEIGDGLPFFQGRADFGFRYPTARVFCTAPTRLAEKDDTLVSVRAPVGDVNMALEKCCIGRGVAAVRHQCGSRSYTYYMMQELESHFSHFEAEGTVFGSINKSDFQALEVVEPSPNVISAFEQMAFTLDSKIELNTSEIITLNDLRDVLLPKLISGQLRIHEAESTAEAAS